MATRYFHKILSLFHRQPNKGEDARSFRTVNGVFGDWTKTAMEDVPPPYTDSPESQAYSSDKQYLPPPPFEAPCLQICPHETTSFEDLQQVVSSLAIKYTDETIDALTTNCHEHCSQLDPATGKTKTVCISSPGLLRASGTYALEDGKDSSNNPSVVLCFDWNLGLLDSIRCQVETATELQQFLGAKGNPLCPHKQMCDPDVITAIFGFVKRPSSQNVSIGCDQCETEINVLAKMEGDDQVCYVTTKRYLGPVGKPDDPFWLAQAKK